MLLSSKGVRLTHSKGLDLGGGAYPRLGVAPPRTPAAAEEGAEEEEAAKRGALMKERKESCRRDEEEKLVDLWSEDSDETMTTDLIHAERSREANEEKMRSRRRWVVEGRKLASSPSFVLVAARVSFF